MNARAVATALVVILGICIVLSAPSAQVQEGSTAAWLSVDEITLTSGKSLQVQPFAVYPGKPPNLPEILECRLHGDNAKTIEIPAKEIVAITFAEERLVGAINSILDANKDDRQSQEDFIRKALELMKPAKSILPQRSHAPFANPWGPLQTRVHDRTWELRRRYLLVSSELAAEEDDFAPALKWSAAWLEQAAVPSMVADAIRTLWTRFGALHLKKGDFAKVRLVLTKLDNQYLHSPAAEPLRQALEDRARTLGKEAEALPDDQALRKLEEAVALWPQGPGLRDDLAKRRKTYRVLSVAVRHLPENLSPGLAWTDSEKHALDLVFEALVQGGDGGHYSPGLLKELPRREGGKADIDLRRDSYWSSGERVTSADVRHTTQLASAASTWRDLLEVPRFEGNPFSLTLTWKQGFLEPFAPLRFAVLPEKFQGKTLSRADDVDFAKAPVGSGPFQYVGRKQEENRPIALFRINPYYPRSDKGPGNIREVRLQAWREPGDLTQPLPHLVLDVPGRSMAALQKIGYAKVHSVPSRRVYLLAVNHRVPSLASVDLRRALAHCFSRSKMLADHFQPADHSAKGYVPLSGPFPAQSWAHCPAPRVPADPYQPELAASLAKKLSKDLAPLKLRLKFPADEPGVKEACTAFADQVNKLFAEAGGKVTIQPEPLQPAQMRLAITQRDYELAYHHWDFPDSTFWLWPWFDPHPAALAPGGPNFLGYDNDAKLQSLLQAAMSQRHFPAVRDLQHSIHAHLYERMPFIPLWQLPTQTAIHPALTIPELNPHAPFSNILEWKVNR